MMNARPTNPLVSATELVTQGLDGLVLVDVSYRLGEPAWGRTQYLSGHLGGARFVDVDTELAEPPATMPADGSARPGTHPGGRHPLPSRERLAGAVRRLGIDADSRVVAVDQGNNLSAARLWWLLRDAGLADVRVLDGGTAAWRAAGGELPTEVPADGEGTFVPEPGSMPVVVADQVLPAIEQGRRVVDVRAAERYRGEVEPIDAVAGHIPGAVNLPATTLAGRDQGFLPAEELASRFEAAGLRPADVVSCGSGLTASQVVLAAEAAGIEGLVLYPGSWSDWISDPARPVACEQIHDWT